MTAPADDFDNLPLLAATAWAKGEAAWSYADEEQSAALGLPEQTDGWGLLWWEASDGQRVTAACERALVAALEDREGDLPGWDHRVHYWAHGWPDELGPWVET